MVIIPVQNGTKLRKNHTTNSDVIEAYGAGSIVEGDSIWTDSVTKDTWLSVIKINGRPIRGWMAIVYKGVVISKLQDDGGGIKVIKAVVTYMENGVVKTEVLVPE